MLEAEKIELEGKLPKIRVNFSTKRVWFKKVTHECKIGILCKLINALKK